MEASPVVERMGEKTWTGDGFMVGILLAFLDFWT
jgi:hypothetical protein